MVCLKSLFSDRRTELAIFLLSMMFLSQPVLSQQIYSSSNSYASYVLDGSGNLYVWGEDEYLHPVVASTTAQDLTPVKVAFPSGVTSWVGVAAGHFFSLAIGNNGNVYAWGSNSNGQLGNGTTTDSDTLVNVNLPSGVTATAVACGHYHSLAIGSDGNVYAWGENNNGQLGNGKNIDSSTPVKVNLPSGFTPAEICAGWYYSLALGTDGSLYVWGGNGQGQLGLGNTTNQSTPVVVPPPTGVTKWTALYGGIYFVVAKGSDGNLYASGQNSYGQLGTGNTTNSTTFTKVNIPAGVTGWKGVACTGSSVLAIASNDTLYGWGYGGSGEMGNGTGTGTNTIAVQVSLPAGVTATTISAGRNHCLALGSDNSFYTWGQGTQGQLGNNTIVNSHVPVKIELTPDLSNQVKLLSVTPGLTDPSIETVHGPHIAVYEYNSQVIQQDKLILFFVGTGASAAGSWSMDSIFATLGYHAITLDYEDNVQTASLGDSVDTTAFERYRLAIITGSPVSGAVVVDTANSVLNRFQKLLLYLVRNDTAGGWNRFVANNEPLWSNIIVAGHSQGSGHAAYLAKMFDVSRVLIFSGPQDYMDIYNAPAPWLSHTGATPPSSYFAFLHQQDPYNVNHQIASCMKLMNTTRPAELTNVNPGDSISGNWRIMVTNIATSSPHGSTILPEFQNVWRHMLTAELPSTPMAPVLASPHGISGVPRKATIVWNKVSSATEYRLQIANDTAFSAVVVDVTVPDTAVGLSSPLVAETKYFWHVDALISGLAGSYSAADSFTTGTGIDAVNETNGIPKEFALTQNYPNPFNPSTTIKVSLARSGIMSLKIYNILGQLIKVVDQSNKAAGEYIYTINLDNFASGVYFYSLRQGQNFMIKRMLLLK